MLLFLDAAGPLRGRPSHRARLAGAMLLFLDGAGPLLGLALHLAGLARTSALFTISRGPPLGRALYRAGLPFVRRAARFALRRTLGSICSARRAFYALLGRGQAAAGDQGRTRNRSQHSFSHLKSPSLVANCRTV
jgi:hypothetical protein